jgi:hypothetical protein
MPSRRSERATGGAMSHPSPLTALSDLSPRTVCRARSADSLESCCHCCLLRPIPLVACPCPSTHPRSGDRPGCGGGSRRGVHRAGAPVGRFIKQNEQVTHCEVSREGVRRSQEPKQGRTIRVHGSTVAAGNAQSSLASSPRGEQEVSRNNQFILNTTTSAEMCRYEMGRCRR